MKKILPALILLTLFACKDAEQEQPASESHIDAARNFIRAALDGRFDEARRYMVQDSLNQNYMDVAERGFRNLDQETKYGYRTSTIRIIKKTNLDDSTSIVIYANTFKNDPDTLKVVRKGKEWLVDLKYLYQHDFDTLTRLPATDTLQ